MALKITDLKINGEDLEKVGIPKGPQMGILLKQLLDAVIEDPMQNTKENLEKLALELYKTKSLK